MTTTALVHDLGRLLDLAQPPVGVTFHEHEPPEHLRSRPAPEPAGCCFWAQAEHHRLHTTAADLANAPTVATAPAAITYEPLDEAEDADVVLVRLTASALLSLQGACPELSVVAKP